MRTRLSSREDESTQELVQQASEGDADAVEQLYERYLPALRRWARGRLPGWARDVMETDDLVQETVLKSLRRIPSFEARRTGAFQSYLRLSVMNRIRDEIRRVKTRPLATTLDEPPARAPSPLEATIGRQTISIYEAALRQLEPGERELVFARIELGFPYQKIAQISGKPSPDAARMAVSRALTKLARAMADEREREAQ